jgi:hypothetical protein
VNGGGLVGSKILRHLTALSSPVSEPQIPARSIALT